MVTFIDLNTTNEDKETVNAVKTAFEYVFRYTKKVNVHVIFNFKSPINIVGNYKYVIFIDIPFEKGNYFRTQDTHTYLNSLAIAVRSYEDNSILKFDENNIYNSNGCWDYRKAIEDERKALRDFVYNNRINNGVEKVNDNMFEYVKHFDIAVFHAVKSSSCNKNGATGNLIFNTSISVYNIVCQAIKQTCSSDMKGANCLVTNSKIMTWENFIRDFINISNEKTNQGILTKKKIEEISKAKTSQGVSTAINTAGNKLCIVTGKAGTGKSLVLMKLMYNKVQKDEERRNHRCRFLTYNNMLVMDIKQTIKGMGNFTPCNASISTLHKFFQDIYRHSPVRVLHMDAAQINRLFSKCHLRVSIMVVLMEHFHKSINTDKDIDAMFIFNYFVNNGKIRIEDQKECEEFCRYLNKLSKMVEFNTLEENAKVYEANKREMFDKFYANNEFLNGYNQILEELYFMFHNKDEFIEKYGMRTVYSEHEIRNTKEFKDKYEKIYDTFLNFARTKFIEENNLISDDDIGNFFEEEARAIQDIAEAKIAEGKETAGTVFQEKIKKILRKVNWSDLILIDEAQDCTPYEKALLLEMHGSDNFVVATGGKDQLIRTSHETNWTVQFGQQLDFQKISLTYVHRQKANIVSFINEFAKEFNLCTSLKASDSIKNQGHVIIDVRDVPKGEIPADIIETLYLRGKDYGCSNYENMMFLLPGGDFMKYNQKTDSKDVFIDKNDTILFKEPSSVRSLETSFPNYLTIIDCTVKEKQGLLNKVGFNNTRCLLYESCRGLEAWNVMCIDLDKFYKDKYVSDFAEEYASEAMGLFKDEESREKYKAQYAALWVFMAITRAMDTLYIKLQDPFSPFSKRILKWAKQLPNIEILEGEYSKQNEEFPTETNLDNLPY